jgi:outer membrane protein TolC
MCTSISHSVDVHGAGRGQAGWFPLTRATVGFDHATHTPAEHALLLDFTNYELGTAARVAVELDLASGRALVEKLRAAIEAAEATGLPG